MNPNKYANAAQQPSLEQLLRDETLALREQVEKLTAERDELAAQNQVLRNMVSEVRDPMDMSELPDLSTSILNRMRAETAERCAEVCDVHATGWNESPGCNPMAGFVASSNCATDIRALAADMEAGK